MKSRVMAIANVDPHRRVHGVVSADSLHGSRMQLVPVGNYATDSTESVGLEMLVGLEASQLAAVSERIVDLVERWGPKSVAELQAVVGRELSDFDSSLRRLAMFDLLNHRRIVWGADGLVRNLPTHGESTVPSDSSASLTN